MWLWGFFLTLMIVSSWNVNSVRARLENIKEYLKKFSPDIVLIQEIKTEDKTYPYDEIKSLGYESYVFGQKSYNGVAILSKGQVNNIKNDIMKDKNKQSRIISSELNYKKKIIHLINVYIPNGNPVDTDKMQKILTGTLPRQASETIFVALLASHVLLVAKLEILLS